MSRKSNKPVEESTNKPDEAPVKSPDVYVVADGKSLLTKRGIIADGNEITANDLPRGDETLQTFIKSGHILAV